MTATPDSFSMSELEALLENAPSEPEVTTDPDNQTEEYIISVAQEVLDLATERSNGPVVHKAMLHMIAAKMVQWHTDIAEEMIKANQTQAAVCWARDAGKFQAIMNILDTISVDDDDDFTCAVK